MLQSLHICFQADLSDLAHLIKTLADMTQIRL